MIRHYLVDIEGVLVADKRYRPIAGVVDWLNALQDQGIGWRLVSNNTTHRPEDLVAALREAGFALAPERLVGALGTGLAWLERSGHRRLGWLGAASLRSWLVERGFEPVDRDAGSCDAVVLGVNPELTVDDLDLALRWLQGGAVLLCLHRNRLWLDAAGAARLGPGAWAAALEVAVPAARTLTAGKPEPAVYLEALESLGASPAETLFISDDPFSDLAGARRLGLATVMVLSGKYPDRAILDELPGAERPDLVLDRADQLRRDMLP